MSAATPRALMLADLARSGLDEKDAKLLKLRPLAREEAKDLTGFAAAAYLIPYFHLDGSVIDDFWRVRYLEPVHGFGEKKPRRYAQPKDSEPRAYFPPYVDWAEIATTPSIAVGITEGEKKAAKACKHGVNMIGLGGVWNFQSNAKEIDFLTELELFEWQDRRVGIAFDA